MNSTIAPTQPIDRLSSEREYWTIMTGFGASDTVSFQQFRENSGFGEHKSARLLKKGIQLGIIFKTQITIDCGEKQRRIGIRYTTSKPQFRTAESGSGVSSKTAESAQKPRSQLAESGSGASFFSLGEIFESEGAHNNTLLLTQQGKQHRERNKPFYSLPRSTRPLQKIEPSNPETEKKVCLFSDAAADFEPILRLFTGPKAESLKNDRKHPYFQRVMFYATLICLDPQKSTRDALNVAFKALSNPDRGLLDLIPENATYAEAIAMNKKFQDVNVTAGWKIRLCAEHTSEDIHENITKLRNEIRCRGSDNPIRNHVSFLKWLLNDEGEYYTKPKRIRIEENQAYLAQHCREIEELGGNAYNDGVEFGGNYISIEDKKFIELVTYRLSVEQSLKKRRDRMPPVVKAPEPIQTEPEIPAENREYLHEIENMHGTYLAGLFVAVENDSFALYKGRTRLKREGELKFIVKASQTHFVEMVQAKILEIESSERTAKIEMAREMEALRQKIASASLHNANE